MGGRHSSEIDMATATRVGGARWAATPSSWIAEAICPFNNSSEYLRTGNSGLWSFAFTPVLSLSLWERTGLLVLLAFD